MKSKLTDKEKCVLGGLAECPDLNATELSKKLGIKRRTFGAIKTKLKNNGVFSNLIVPNFNALGCEILTISYGTFNPLIKFENREAGVQKIRECEEIVHVYSTDDEYLLISCSKNFTEFRKKASEILRLYKENNFIDSLRVVHFPYEISKYQLLGFSELIKMLFGLDVKREKKGEKVVKRVRLTKKWKKVLYAMVKVPDAKNAEIADITGITAHSVSRIKKKLREKKIIRTLKIPNLGMLGFELLALVHVKYKLNKRNGYEYQPVETFRINSGVESISISQFKNYTDYKGYYDRKLGYLRENDLIEGGPGVLLFPIQKLRHVKDFSFAPLVKRLLKIDVEF